MNENDYNRELLSFSEKIALSEMEEGRAHERTLQLKYELARYQLEVFLAMAKQATSSPAPSQVSAACPVVVDASTASHATSSKLAESLERKLNAPH